MTKTKKTWCTQSNNGLHTVTTYNDGTVKILNTKSGAVIDLTLDRAGTSKLLDVIFNRD